MSIGGISSNKIKTKLKHFYNHEARKYYETRQKYRKEGEYLIETINKLPYTSPLRILEFGCGWGRFLSFLKAHCQTPFKYVGIDLSEGLLEYAKKDHPEASFICQDICEYLPTCTQESFDIIVGTSSFQHIPTPKERLFVLKHCYRILTYEGKLLMTNRAYSDRFYKKYHKQVVISRLKRMVTLGYHQRRDLQVPWTNSHGVTTERYYHLFSLEEYEKLAQYSGFMIDTNCYLDTYGEKIKNETWAKSSLFIATKFPCK